MKIVVETKTKQLRVNQQQKRQKKKQSAIVLDLFVHFTCKTRSKRMEIECVGGSGVNAICTTYTFVL